MEIGLACWTSCTPRADLPHTKRWEGSILLIRENLFKGAVAQVEFVGKWVFGDLGRWGRRWRDRVFTLEQFSFGRKKWREKGEWVYIQVGVWGPPLKIEGGVITGDRDLGWTRHKREKFYEIKYAFQRTQEWYISRNLENWLSLVEKTTMPLGRVEIVKLGVSECWMVTGKTWKLLGIILSV